MPPPAIRDTIGWKHWLETLLPGDLPWKLGELVLQCLRVYYKVYKISFANVFIPSFPEENKWTMRFDRGQVY